MMESVVDICSSEFKDGNGSDTELEKPAPNSTGTSLSDIVKELMRN
jgi:hypothetical protein